MARKTIRNHRKTKYYVRLSSVPKMSAKFCRSSEIGPDKCASVEIAQVGRCGQTRLNSENFNRLYLRNQEELAKILENGECVAPVSYTHLTLPTSDLV